MALVLMHHMCNVKETLVKKEIRAALKEMELFAKIVKGNSASVLTQALHSLTDNKILKDNPAFRLGVIASINTKTSEKYYNYLGDFWMENSVTVDHSKRFPGRIASLIVELLENKKEGLDESLSLALLVLLSSITKCQSEWQWQ